LSRLCETHHWASYNKGVKRRALILLLFVFAGAIINIAVAWGCSNWQGELQYSKTSNAKSQWDWLIERGSIEPKRGAIEYVYEIVSCEQFGAEIQTYMVRESAQEGAFGSFMLADFHAAQIVAAGWPAKSLTGQSVDQEMRMGMSTVWAGGIPFVLRPSNRGLIVVPLFTIGTINFGGRYTPFLPLWPGFAINTIFYAAIVWVLFAVPGAIRRRVRRKRGQCAACGYSRRGSSGMTCPECGATAIKQKAETQKAETQKAEME
jgi:hypothetical protein